MLGHFFKRSAKYTRAEPKEDDEELLPSSSTASLELRTGTGTGAVKRQDSAARVAVRTAFICTVVYLGILVCIGTILKDARFVEDVDSFCLNHISRYSPVLKEVKPNWHTQQYNGSFLHENIYRQAAGPDVDAAWAALGADYRSVVIPANEAEQTGLRLDQVKVSQIYGGGFPANVEGLHHIHCLNLLRKALWWNYEYYRDKKEGPFVNSEYIVRYHVTHCMDIIRQQLMCVTDIGVLGQVWWQSEDMENPMPFVDFNTKHRCRDFEAIRKWAEEHQLPPESDVDMSIFYEPPKPGDLIYPEIP